MEAKAPSVLTLVAALVAMMWRSSYAYDFYVGGRQGWVQNPSESYNNWTARNRFQVNDRLVFRYKKGEDSVLVVNEPDYRACNTSNPIRRLDSGDSVFQFDRSGPFYFISGVPARCQGGEKMAVVVLALRGGPRPGAPPLPAPAAPSPLLPPSAAPRSSPPSAGPLPSPPEAPSPALLPPAPTAGGPAPTAEGPSPTAGGPSPSAGGPSPTAGGPAPTAGGPSPTAEGPSPTAGGPSPAAGGPAPTAGGPAPTAGGLVPTAGGPAPTTGGPSAPTGPPSSELPLGPGRPPSGSSSLGVSLGTAAAAMALGGLALLF